jgi:hypothetical protein
MAGREQLGVKDLGEDFQTFDDARPWTIEILIAVGDKDAISLHPVELAPAGTALKQRHLVKRSCHVEAARVHQDDIRVGGNNLVPVKPQRRLARRAKQVLATGDLYEFRHPVATGHKRIDPLDHGGARARSRGAALPRDAAHARFQLFDRTLPLAFASQCAGDFSDVLPDVAEGA